MLYFLFLGSGHQPPKLRLRKRRHRAYQPERAFKRPYCLSFHSANVEVFRVDGFVIPQSPQDFRVRVSHVALVQLLLDDPEYHKGEVTGKEMGPYPVFPAHEDGPSVEIALHDAEAFLDFPSSPVDPDDLSRIVVQVGRHGIEAIILRFLLEPFPVDREYFLLGDFAVFRDTVHDDEPSHVVLVDAFPDLSLPDKLHRTLQLPFPDTPLILPQSPAVCRHDPFLEAVASHGESLVMVEDNVPEIRIFPDFLQRIQPSGSVSESFPSAIAHQSRPDVLAYLLERLRDDESMIFGGVEPEVPLPRKAAVRADDELLDAEPFRHQLLKRYHRLLLVRPPGIDAHGDGEAVPVKEKTHLDDGVGPVLLALPVGSEAVLLLDLEVEVGAVVVGDACVDVGILLHSLECLFLDEIEVFCHQAQGTIHMLKVIVRGLREGKGLLVGRALAEGAQHPSDDEVPHDPVEVVRGLRLVPDASHDHVQAERIVDGLRKDVAQHDPALLHGVEHQVRGNLKGRLGPSLIGKPFRLGPEMGYRVRVLLFQFGKPSDPSDVLRGRLFSFPDADGVVKYRVVFARRHDVKVHSVLLLFKISYHYHIKITHITQYVF